jgi:hypothetical protein
MGSEQRNDEVMRVATIDRSGFITKAAALVGLMVLPAMLYAGFAHAADTSSAVAALVMETSGVTKPPLAVHREVAAGTQIAIGPGGHLSLLHYATCSIVTFSGGTVKVSEQGLEAEEVNIESRKPGPCPRVHRISLGGPGPLGGGIVSRGMPLDASQYADVASDGLVVITGARAQNAVTADVLDSNRRLVEGDIPIRQEAFRLSGLLPPRRPYFITIHFGGRSEPVEVPVSISASNAKGLLILRLE